MFVRLLGPVSAGPNVSECLHVPGQVPGLVLGQLALAAGRSVSADSLIEATWDSPPPSSRNAIQVAVTKLRKQLGNNIIRGERGRYAITDTDLEVDWHQAKQLHRESFVNSGSGRWMQSLEAAGSAMALFVGEPMAGIRADFADRLRTLASSLQVSVEQLRASALVELHRPVEAIEILRPLASAAPLDEPVHVLLMRALAADEHQAEALAVFEGLRRSLSAELGVAPTSTTESTFLSILNGQQRSKVNVAAVTALPPLPQAAAPLFGRTVELEQLAAAIKAGHRMITIAGPVGIGKSRLALAVAHQRTEQDGRPAVLIDLSGLTIATGSTKAAAAEVKSRIDQIIDQGHRGWGRTLAGTSTLLLLDNAQPANPAVAAAVTALLDIPGVEILLTCVGPLQLSAEYTFELAPLTAPAALQLVLDQVRTTGSTNSELYFLGQIAEFGQGLPLLLELLASALAWYGAEELARALNSEPAESWIHLEHPAQDRPERHRSFAAAVRSLLTPLSAAERAATAALALPSGEFDQQMATWLIRASDPAAEPRLVLTRLLDCAVLQRIRYPDSIRFRMLPPIRAAFKASSEVPKVPDIVHHAYAEHQLGLVPEFWGEQQLSPDSADVLQALNWLWRHDPELAVEHLGTVLFYWYQRSAGRSVEREWVDTWVRTALRSHRGSSAARSRIAIVALLDLLRWRDGQTGDMERLSMKIDQQPHRLGSRWSFRRDIAESEFCRLHDDPQRSLSLLKLAKPTDTDQQIARDLLLLRWYRHAGASTDLQNAMIQLFRQWDSAELFTSYPDSQHQIVRAFLALGELELAHRALPESPSAAALQRKPDRIPGQRDSTETADPPTQTSLAVEVDRGWLYWEYGNSIRACEVLRHALIPTSPGRINRFRSATLLEAVILGGLGCRAAGRTTEAHALASLAARLHRPMLLDAYAMAKLAELWTWAAVSPDSEEVTEHVAVQILHQALTTAAASSAMN